jgi:hypothetical protein
MISKYDVIIIGGGAAGFFTAINCVENNPKLKVAILERGKEVLTKVRISGGGRCNVTHACFVPNDLVKFYPRGEKELKGPFNTFCSGDTIDWFQKHGVELKIEEDGRMFPTSDSSQTIIDCFLQATEKLKIDVLTNNSVQELYNSDDYWKITTNTQVYSCQKIVVCTGSNPKIWELLSQFKHTIIPPVPSLFTFNIKDTRIKDLMGLSTEATVKIINSKLEASGPVLITHWGISGPGILKISAWGARELAALNYQFTLKINWLNDATFDEVSENLLAIKSEHAKKNITKFCPFNLPKRLWENLLIAATIPTETKWAELSKKQLNLLIEQLINGHYKVNGKSTFKDEFVTAGGIDLKEINFKTMESKVLPNIYFAGEIVNIDAITGGFNFQNAWTSGYLVANALTD